MDFDMGVVRWIQWFDFGYHKGMDFSEKSVTRIQIVRAQTIAPARFLVRCRLQTQ